MRAWTSSVFDVAGRSVSVLGEGDGELVAAFADGGVAVLESKGLGQLGLGPEVDGLDVRALEVPRGEHGLDVYRTLKGQDTPVLLSFDLVPVVTELPLGVTSAQAISLPEANVTLVATLLTAPPGEESVRVAVSAGLVDVVVFATFNPSFLSPPHNGTAEGGDVVDEQRVAPAADQPWVEVSSSRHFAGWLNNGSAWPSPPTRLASCSS